MALDWEYTVTKQITALLDRASSEKVYVAHGFLEWFAREQLEEVSTMDTLLKMVQRGRMYTKWVAGLRVTAAASGEWCGLPRSRGDCCRGCRASRVGPHH